MHQGIYEIAPFDKAQAAPAAAAASVVPNCRVAEDTSLLGLGYLRPLSTNFEVANSQAQQFPVTLIWKNNILSTANLFKTKEPVLL